MPTRTATAEWKGEIRGGSGSMKMASGAYEGPYSFESRFKEGTGTNPEELIGAAHAGCYSMALSGELGGRGIKPESITTEAKVDVEKAPGGFAITKIDLITRVVAPGADEAMFQEAANAAKEGCPVSKALAGVGTINLDASLQS